MKKYFFVFLFVLVLSSLALAGSCPEGICHVDGGHYISTRAYNLGETEGNIVYGRWEYVDSQKNNTSCYYVWKTTIQIVEDKKTLGSIIKKWFGLSDSSGKPVTHYLEVLIPPMSEVVIEKRWCTKYTYYTYDIKCEFWLPDEGKFVYTSHESDLKDDKKNQWEEYRGRIVTTLYKY